MSAYGFPKPLKGSALLKRREDRKKLVAHEQGEMRAAKKRDSGKCRWPRCEYAKSGLTIQACHYRHRGHGGNPSGDRTERRLLVALCARHHQLWDLAEIEIEPLDLARWFDGPAMFSIRNHETGKFEHIASEKSIHESVAVGA